MMKELIFCFIVILLLANCEPKEQNKVENTDEWVDLSFKNDSVDFQTIQMFDENSGYIAGIPKVSCLIPEPIIIDGSIISEPYIKKEITRTDPSNIAESIYKTTNGGKEWISISTPFVGITKIAFTDLFNGYVLSWRDGVFKTTDGGITWEHVLGATYVTSSGWSSIVFNFLASSNVNCIALSQLFYFITNNGGNSWKKINKTEIPSKIFSVKEDTVFYYKSNALYYTLDNFVTQQKICDIESFQDVYIKNEKSIYVLQDRTILITHNAGANWRSYPTSEYCDKMLISSDSIGYLLDGYRNIYIFDINQTIPTRIMKKSNNNQINDICFPVSNIGYAVGMKGLILKYKHDDKLR